MSRPGDRPYRRRSVVIAAVGVAFGLVLPAALPDLLVPVGLRLALAALLGLGAWSIVRGIGHIDLATGAAAGVGGYVGGAGVALLGGPAALALIGGPLGGALTSGLVGAVGARVGRVLGALTSLAVGAAIVGLMRTGEVLGGPAGFHAVPYLSASGRIELAIALVVTVLGLALAPVVRPLLARGALATGGAHAAASLGRRPSGEGALASLPGGALLGLAGALGALGSGSLVPDAYGLPLSAALALAAVVAGASPLAGVVVAVAGLGPGALAPGVAVIATAPLLVTGVLGLALLAIVPGGLVRRRPLRPPEIVGGTGGGPTPPAPRRRMTLTLRDAQLPGGMVSLRAEPGEIVALTGPNGAGKSTLLARIGGQLPDDGVVEIDVEGDHGAIPDRAVARGRAGVGRTWQHPPQVDVDDLLTAGLVGGDRVSARWATDQLGVAAGTPAGAMLVVAVAHRPGLLLLDEPAGRLPVERVAALIEGLAAAGTAIVVAEHRREIAAIADRVVEVGRDGP